MRRNWPSGGTCAWTRTTGWWLTRWKAEWNRKLRALQQAQQEYEPQPDHDRVAIDEQLRTRLHTLATESPRLWGDPDTPDRERKRLLRLLVEDVTLVKREQFHIHIRFPGGATKTLELPLPRRATVTQRAVVAEVDGLLDEYSYEAIADILNARGFVSGYGKPFRGRMIARLTIEYGLESRFDRLRARGMLTLDEMADRLGISTRHVKIWRAAGPVARSLVQRQKRIPLRRPGSRSPTEGKRHEIIEKARAGRERVSPRDGGAV